MRNISNKFVEKNETQVVKSEFFFEYIFVYEMRCKNIVEPYRPHMKVWSMHLAFWINKTTNTLFQNM